MQPQQLFSIPFARPEPRFSPPGFRLLTLDFGPRTCRSVPDACLSFLFADEMVSNTIRCEAHMALKPMSRKTPGSKRPVEQYDHKAKKRANNPPVGLVDAKSDPVEGKKSYAYDPHLDPALVWAGKAERTSFAIPTVSLHVHERIDPRSIIEAVRKKNGSDYEQMSLFSSKAENPPLREAIEFYKHAHNWSNRLVAGDSLLVMNSLLEKEGMAGQVQMLYFDPPYGIKYGSNFQPFVNKRDVKDGKDEDLTAEPEMVKAFRDTWELGLHSYLSYLRDRLLLARELLHESGSVFVQISDENVHHVREILDEVFGAKNFVSLITFAKTTGASSELLPMTSDYVLWYARDVEKVKYRQLYHDKVFRGQGASGYTRVQLPDGTRRFMTAEEYDDPSLLPDGSKIYALDNMTSQRPPGDFPVKLDEKIFRPKKGYWKTGEEGMERLMAAKRLEPSGDYVRYVRFLDDFPVFPLTNVWSDTSVAGFTSEKVYVVQTNAEGCSALPVDDHRPRRFGVGHHLRQWHDGFRRGAMGPPLDDVRHVPCRAHARQAAADDGGV